MLTLLEQFSDQFGPLRLFGDRTFRGLLAAAWALWLGIALGPWLIRTLQKFKTGSGNRTESAQLSLDPIREAKRTTPSMGGLLIFFCVTSSTLLFAQLNLYVWTALYVYVVCTAIGFADDFLKMSKRNSKGLPGKYKLAGQTLAAVGAYGLLCLDPVIREQMHELWVPFFKEPLVAAMPWFSMLGFLFLVLAGSSNAINLTDGLDGLAIGCTIIVVLVMGGFAYAAGNVVIANYLLISHIPGADELAIVCAGLLGASLAFLWYNAHPAKLFMGDTGSLALGGLIGAIAFMTHQPFTLVIVGGVFVMEAVSVILQVASFKATGKRIFKMAPIHHHFQKEGWFEMQVVLRFWIMSFIFAIIGLATLKLR